MEGAWWLLGPEQGSRREGRGGGEGAEESRRRPAFTSVGQAARDITPESRGAFPALCCYQSHPRHPGPAGTGGWGPEGLSTEELFKLPIQTKWLLLTTPRGPLPPLGLEHSHTQGSAAPS